MNQCPNCKGTNGYHFVLDKKLRVYSNWKGDCRTEDVLHVKSQGRIECSDCGKQYGNLLVQGKEQENIKAIIRALRRNPQGLSTARLSELISEPITSRILKSIRNYPYLIKELNSGGQGGKSIVWGLVEND